MKLIKFSLAVVLALSLVSCSVDSPEAAPSDLNLKITTVKTKPIEAEALKLINDYRTSKGLNTLGSMTLIKSVAETHTEYMVQLDEVNHDNFYQRSSYLKENAGAIKVSENVAYGYTSSESLVNAWINSDSHRATIEGDFNYFEISAEQNSEGKWYYTNMFIKK